MYSVKRYMFIYVHCMYNHMCNVQCFTLSARCKGSAKPCNTYQATFSPEICSRGVHNEIHNIKKPSEVLPSQVFQVVANSNQRAHR